MRYPYMCMSLNKLYERIKKISHFKFYLPSPSDKKKKKKQCQEASVPNMSPLIFRIPHCSVKILFKWQSCQKESG